jgi:hypothetical protein
MDAATQLNVILISLASWCTLTTIGIFLARRDFKLGLRKWFLLKFRKQPLKIRYHGPDKNVVEYIVSMKDKGETVTMFDKKMLFIKTGKGMTFFVDEASLKRCDDGLNELNYSYRSVTPTNMTTSEEEVKEERENYLKRITSPQEKESDGKMPVDVDMIVRATDPKRLNKLIDYIYLAAKADALAAAMEVEKWVKWGVFIGVGTLLLAVLIWYTLDGKVIPLLQTIGANIQGAAQQVIGL